MSFGDGGGVGSGEEIDESELILDGEPGAESVNGGVSMSPSPSSGARLSGERVSAAEVSSSMAPATPLWRLASDCELSDDAEDSSNVRFGDR